MKAAFAQFLQPAPRRHGLPVRRQPGRAAVPFAQLPRHQLHGDAAGHAAAGRRPPHTPGLVATQRDLHGRPRRPEPLHLPAGDRRASANGRANTVYATWHARSLESRPTSSCPRRSRRGGCSRFPMPTARRRGLALPPTPAHRNLRRSATPATPATRSSTSSPDGTGAPGGGSPWAA